MHELGVVDGRGQSRDDIQTKWEPYIRTLPTTFDTPMFWSAEELEELQGTAVVGRSINSIRIWSAPFNISSNIMVFCAID